MTYKLVDVTRGKVLQEFETVEQAEKALRHQSVEDYVRLEIQADAKPKPKAKKAKKVESEESV
jgi:ferredoxin